MPALPTLFAKLVAEGPLPLDELAAQPLQALTRTELRVIARQGVDLLGPGAGSLLVELGVAPADIPAPIRAAELRASPVFAAALAGTQAVGRRPAADRVAAKLVQRALQAYAARVEHAAGVKTLSTWGADGGFGDETEKAVRELQAQHGFPDTGVVGAAEVRLLLAALDDAPVPDLFDAGHPVIVLGRGALRVVSIAEHIAAATPAAPFSMRVDGARYTYHAQQFGTAPTGGLLRAPGGVAYDVASSDYWKCNIFGGTVLALAELAVPTFQAGRYRHFPRAERFGEALSRKRGWTLLAHLDHRDPADPNSARRSPALDDDIRKLLRSIQPGDIFFVDHPGEPGDDGGHTRICTRAAEDDDPDCAPLFAQARHDAVHQERDGMRELAGGRETQFWLLRSEA
jgi:hypothetical protein